MLAINIISTLVRPEGIEPPLTIRSPLKRRMQNHSATDAFGVIELVVLVHLLCKENIMVQCLSCGKKTENPKFCNRSCSVSYNNRKTPKRKPEHKCLRCSTNINSQSRYCKTCKVERFEPHNCLCKHCGRTYVYDRVKQMQRNYCSSCSSNRRRRSIKLQAIEYKGGKCIVCGYHRCSRSLDFHHIDPTAKAFTISSAMSLTWEKIKKELDKCVLLCSNCHGEVHDNIISVDACGIAPPSHNYQL